MENNQGVTLAFRASVSVYKKIKYFAKKEDMNSSQFLRKMCEKYIAEMEKNGFKK